MKNIHEIQSRVERSGGVLEIRSRSFIRLHPADLSGLQDLTKGQVMKIAVGRTKDQEADHVAAAIWSGAIDFAEDPIWPEPKESGKSGGKKGGSKSGKKGGSKSGKKGSPPEEADSGEGGESGSAPEEGDSNFDPSKPPEGGEGKE